MITQVSYARLYNLGNYENERFEVVVTVEDGDWAGAFTEARDATDAARLAAQIARAEEQERIAEERKAAQVRSIKERQERDAQEQGRDLDF